MSKKRVTHPSAFKAKVALAAIRQEKTLSQLAAQFKVHPTVISKWKALLLEHAASVFADGRANRNKKGAADDPNVEALFEKIGRLEVENDFLKKSLNCSIDLKRLAIEYNHPILSIEQQCTILQIPRATFYYKPIPVPPEELELTNRIDRFHTEHPDYGSRRLGKQFGISRDKAHRLMQVMHLAATYPKRKTTIPNSEHAKFPCLLGGVNIVRINQVWSTDITYIGLAQGFMYLTAIIDWYSRMILAWRLSNSMDTAFCVEALEEALTNFGEPEIFNTDQGSQFTSRKFIRVFDDLETKNSMDGKGRWIDNVYIERFWWTVKHENVYLRRYETPTDLGLGLETFFDWYNNGRIHSSLEYFTPKSIYFGENVLTK